MSINGAFCLHDQGGLLSHAAMQRQCEFTHQASNKKVYFTNYEDRNSVNKKASQVLTNGSDSFLGKPIYEHSGMSGNPSSTFSVFFEKSVRNVYDTLERDFDFFVVIRVN